MPTGVEIIQAIDAAVLPLLAALDSRGALSIPGPPNSGITYTYYRDGSNPLGFSVIASHQAASIQVGSSNQPPTIAQQVKQVAVDTAQKAVEAMAAGVS